MNIGPRLEVATERIVPAGRVHQLVRFNICNLGEQPTTAYTIALKDQVGETLSCELVPPVVIASGARYPVVVEVAAGPVAKAVDIEVKHVAGQRFWVSTQLLPSL